MSLRKNRMAMRSKAPRVAFSMASNLECPEIRSIISIIPDAASVGSLCAEHQDGDEGAA